MNFAVAGDKYGLEHIARIKHQLESDGHTVEDFGGAEAQLEEMIPAVVAAVKAGARGILVCGTGIGVEIGANRFKGVRATLATNPEMAEWSRQYDNTNVLCLSAWATKEDEVEPILEAWLESDYDGSEKRLAMLKTFDTWS